MSVTLTINHKKIQAVQGQTILQAARQNEIEIPTLCFHKDLSPTGNCRICVVDVAGQRLLPTACVTPVVEGMVIETHSARVLQSRKLNLELMLANHPQDCITCDVSGECELQDLAYEFHVNVPTWG